MISVTFIRTIVSYLGGYTLGLGIVGIWFGVLADQMFQTGKMGENQDLTESLPI